MCEYISIHVDTKKNWGLRWEAWARWCSGLIVEFVRMRIYKMVAGDPIRVQGNWGLQAMAMAGMEQHVAL